MTSTAKRRSENIIEMLRDFILKNQFHQDLKEDDAFFFNLKFNEHNELIIGDGSNQDHFNLMMSSKYMLSFLTKNGTGHTDYIWHN